MRTIKILLGVAGVLAALLLAGGFIWWRKSGREMFETVRVARTEGSSFGRTATAEQCIDETVRRLGSEESGLTGMLVHTTFLSGCASVATGLDAVCEQRRGLGLQQRLNQSIERCRVGGARNPLCPQVLEGLDGLCRRKSPRTGGA